MFSRLLRHLDGCNTFGLAVHSFVLFGLLSFSAFAVIPLSKMDFY